MIDTAFAHRPVGKIIVLRLFDADRQENFERGVGLGSHERRKGSGFEARLLKVGMHARAWPVRPGLAERPRPTRRERGLFPVWMRRQPLASLLPSPFVRLVHPQANFRIQTAPFGEFE